MLDFHLGMKTDSIAKLMPEEQHKSVEVDFLLAVQVIVVQLAIATDRGLTPGRRAAVATFALGDFGFQSFQFLTQLVDLFICGRRPLCSGHPEHGDDARQTDITVKHETSRNVNIKHVMRIVIITIIYQAVKGHAPVKASRPGRLGRVRQRDLGIGLTQKILLPNSGACLANKKAHSHGAGFQQYIHSNNHSLAA